MRISLQIMMYVDHIQYIPFGIKKTLALKLNISHKCTFKLSIGFQYMGLEDGPYRGAKAAMRRLLDPCVIRSAALLHEDNTEHDKHAYSAIVDRSHGNEDHGSTYCH